MEIAKIRKLGNKGYRMITIPRKSDFKIGDYVQIIKIEDSSLKFAVNKKNNPMQVEVQNSEENHLI